MRGKSWLSKIEFSNSVACEARLRAQDGQMTFRHRQYSELVEELIAQGKPPQAAPSEHLAQLSSKHQHV